VSNFLYISCEFFTPRHTACFCWHCLVSHWGGPTKLWHGK